MSKDYYEVLGLSKGASKDEIKKAYRDQAKKHHPDRGGDEKEFKKIQEAYEVLSDDQKRSQYDQFGSAGPQFSGANGFGGGFSGFSQADFGGFEDIFSSFFGGGMAGQARGRSQSKQRGSDLEVEVELDFDESMRGVQKTFSTKLYVECEACEGKGGKGEKNCGTCAGKGSVSQRFQTPFGAVAQQTVCPTCHGIGKEFETPCAKCGSEGRVEKKEKIEVDIPAGIVHGETLQLAGKGEVGRRGGSRGDLFVHVSVRPSAKFERRGVDLISQLEISVFDAIVGGAFEVETFWGKVDLKVPENTCDRQFLRIRGKGVKRGNQVGDHMVKIVYRMPKKVSKKLRELLEEAKKQ